MLAKFALAASALVSLASADVIPTGPTPGDSFNEGANCLIQYDVDTTGNWGNTTIQLMSGSNFDMVVVADVITGLDGSTGGVINWECPAVTPNSQIYFYQYSAPGQNTSWTGRFTIASATGESTEPTNSTTTAGVTVKYGYGALSDASETIASPSVSGVTGSGSSATASGSSAATSSAASSSASSARIPVHQRQCFLCCRFVGILFDPR
ncbi:hypothetical protein BCR35DRAFT_132439 [Leucosporidium creatinivorum]|uniref:Yeast cell wall synthesis Kre9/Knh1-like N-terminal domain-containing protein n=1 Tax=Leucosporidium creatinivorum TaxID=106004 RepID=A0A1Y2G0C1_9BASI|nr:hypothetical protein BCR35DRAFT_132439 [Leucosporidium creatinivorum]